LWFIIPAKLTSNQSFHAGGGVSWFGVVLWHWLQRSPLNGSVGTNLGARGSEKGSKEEKKGV
jgi:hypothetical protein